MNWFRECSAVVERFQGCAQRRQMDNQERENAEVDNNRQSMQEAPTEPKLEIGHWRAYACVTNLEISWRQETGLHSFLGNKLHPMGDVELVQTKRES